MVSTAERQIDSYTYMYIPVYIQYQKIMLHTWKSNSIIDNHDTCQWWPIYIYIYIYINGDHMTGMQLLIVVMLCVNDAVLRTNFSNHSILLFLR